MREQSDQFQSVGECLIYVSVQISQKLIYSVMARINVEVEVRGGGEGTGQARTG